jgi:hypothetical protein
MQAILRSQELRKCKTLEPCQVKWHFVQPLKIKTFHNTTPVIKFCSNIILLVSGVKNRFYEKLIHLIMKFTFLDT